MKAIHKALLTILILLALLIGWFWFGGALRADASVATARAADFPEAFSAAADIVKSGAAPQKFADAPLDSAADYQLIDASISLKNYGFLPAEWLELTVTGADGDVAVYSLSGLGGDVPAFGDGYLNVKLITRSADAPRSATVSYYVFGMHRSITVKLK